MRFTSNVFAAFELFSAVSLAAAQMIKVPAVAAAPATPATGIKINKMYSTTHNRTMFVQASTPEITFVSDASYPQTSVNKTDSTPLQIGIDVLDNRDTGAPFEGVGGGITDGGSIVLQDLKKDNPDAYWRLLRQAFDASAAQRGVGAGLNFVRFPLGASDSGFTQYSYADTVDGSPDVNLTQFTVDKSPKMWATMKDILTVNSEIKFFAVPYSPPAWMKTTNSLNGGSVKQEYEPAWARYLCRAMADIKKKGVNVYRLSLQNEPYFEPKEYPSARSEPDQQARIGKLVRECLDKDPADLKSIKLIAWDHNWSPDTFAVDVMDKAEDKFEGAGWHCFVGNPDGQLKFGKNYPNKEQWLTQCTKETQNGAEIWRNMRNTFSGLIKGTVTNGARAVMLWNIVLQVDPDGFTTPQLPGTCQNCLASFLVHPNATSTPVGQLPGQVTPMQKSSARRPSLVDLNSEYFQLFGRQDAAEQAFTTTSDFAALAHLGRATHPVIAGETLGRLLGVSTSEDTGAAGTGRKPRVVTLAFRSDNADAKGNSRFSLVILQQNDHYEYGAFEPAEISVRFRGAVVKITVPPGLYTIDWLAAKNA